MPRRTALTALAVGVALLSACGSNGDTAPPAGGEPPPAGTALTIDAAIASTLEGPLMVKGFVVAAEGEPVMFCSALLESYPPQCGGTSLVVRGLDLATVEGLVRTEGDPSLAPVSWTEREISLLGDVDGGVLTVSTASA
jgi:hypothetical protein